MSLTFTMPIVPNVIGGLTYKARVFALGGVEVIAIRRESRSETWWDVRWRTARDHIEFHKDEYDTLNELRADLTEMLEEAWTFYHEDYISRALAQQSQKGDA